MSAQKRVRLVAAIAVMVAGLAVALAAPWASADPPPNVSGAGAVSLPPAATDVPVKRREAVTRFPVGTFIKEFEAQPYGDGSLTFTYSDDKVSSLIEVNVPEFGGEVEFATESELSMSQNGVIYGIINSVRLTKLKLIPELTKDFPLTANAYPLIEPLVNEVMVDLPFSYRCRIDGDRMTISNYRILISGPNPFGKLGLFSAGDAFGYLAYGQAIGTAMEGTYTRAAEGPPEKGVLPRAKSAPRRVPGRTQ